MKTKRIEKTIGGLRFVADLPRAANDPEGVEGKHLVQLEQAIMRALCRYGKPSGDGLKFLRERIRLKAADFAALVDVDPATVSRWENEERPVPAPIWEIVVLAAEDHLDKRRSTTLDRIREHQKHRDADPRMDAPSFMAKLVRVG